MSNLADWAYLKQAWQGKRVLVTGAGGFIGSHLVETLLGLGATVEALVKYNSASHWGHLEGLPEPLKQNLIVHLGCLTDPFALQKLVHAKLDAVFHLGALIGIPYSYVAPQHYVAVNVTGTLNVLEACLRAEVPRLVVTSTSETYGTAQTTPMEETHPLQGQSPYAATKIAADKLAESYYCSFQLPVVVLRPFNTYGPRQSARAFIPSITSQLLTQPVVKVGDLTPCRDLLFVSDTVRGFLAAALCNQALGEVVHLGTGQTHSMQTVLETMLRLAGKQGLPIEQQAERVRPEASEVRLLLCNPAKAKALMGWQAEVGLEEGLQQVLQHVKHSIAAYKPLVYGV